MPTLAALASSAAETTAAPAKVACNARTAVDGPVIPPLLSRRRKRALFPAAYPAKPPRSRKVRQKIVSRTWY